MHEEDVPSSKFLGKYIIFFYGVRFLDRGLLGEKLEFHFRLSLCELVAYLVKLRPI